MREKFAQGKGEFSLRSFSLLLSIFLLLFVGLAGTQAFAQVTTATGSIQGTITDPSGAVVPSAKITITNPATGAAIHVTASSSGSYASGPLLPGDYQVRVDVYRCARDCIAEPMTLVATASEVAERGVCASLPDAGPARPAEGSQAVDGEELKQFDSVEQ